jgi:hypothetical protein
MSEDRLLQVLNMSAEGRQRAESFVEEGQYYGWKLESVQTKPLGDFTECTMDFDQQRIVFLSRRGVADHGQPHS